MTCRVTQNDGYEVLDDADPFVCPVYGLVSRDFCHENYVDAHAPDKENSPCWRCRIGTKVRMLYAARSRRMAPSRVVDGAHAYYTEHRNGRGYCDKIELFVRWMHMDSTACDEADDV